MPSAVARLVSELTEEKARALLVELLTILRASLAKSLDPQSRLFTSLLFRLRDAKSPAQAADV